MGYVNKTYLSTQFKNFADKIVKTFSKIGHKHVKSDITDFPTSMPANGGNAATVGGHTVGVNVPSDAKFTDTIYSLPTASSSTLGGVKTTSTVTSNSGYTACPIISGVPYYKDTNTTYTLTGLMGSTAKGSATQPVYWNGSAWTNTTYTLGKSVPSNAVFTDTTYSSKAATSGGTDVSLVTTGEKAIWNAKTSNIGTVTGIKLGTKSYSPSSGTVSLPAYPTTLPANGGTADKVGHTLKVNVEQNGAAASYPFDGSADMELNLNIITTTATQTSKGLLSASDKQKLDGIESGATKSKKPLTINLIDNSGPLITPISYTGEEEVSININNWEIGTTAGKVCEGNDARLSDARPASDVYTWAKAASKPSYTAAEVGAISTSASCNKNWHWSGQGGQPSWLWGGNDGTNMYVYNPSNFSVNYAKTAGAVTNLGTVYARNTSNTYNLSGSGQWITLASVTLPAGVYVGYCWTKISGTPQSRMMLIFSNSSSETNAGAQSMSDDNMDRPCCTTPIALNLGSKTTMYLRVYTSLGSTRAILNGWYIIRIK